MVVTHHRYSVHNYMYFLISVAVYECNVLRSTSMPHGYVFLCMDAVLDCFFQKVVNIVHLIFVFPFVSYKLQTIFPYNLY